MARSAAQVAAAEREREVKALLRTRFLPPQVVTEAKRGGGGFEYWQTGTSGSIVVDPGLEGEWTLTMYWRFRNAPGDAGDAVLAESSIGLSVQHELLVEGQPACLVRYDLDHFPGANGITRGAHVQTYQFKPLEDRIHYAVLGLPQDFEWDAEQVLDFLLGPLSQDLADRGWPPS